jgi:2-hydroxychromene-2-carboxylate isomerase
MSKEIHFYFDFISPYSYLASTVLPRVAERHGATVRYFPFALVDLMKMVGNRPTTLESKNKGAYVMVDLARWARHYGVKLSPNAHWATIDFAELGRAALVAIEEGRGKEFADAVFGAVWVDGVDLSQRSRLGAVLDGAGFGGLLERAASADCVARYERATRDAAERGVFGSPTMFVGQEMFFGNDRFDFLEASL